MPCPIAPHRAPSRPIAPIARAAPAPHASPNGGASARERTHAHAYARVRGRVAARPRTTTDASLDPLSFRSLARRGVRAVPVA